MRVNINILYSNGESEEITQELTEKLLKNITYTLDVAFREGTSAVLRLGSEDEMNFINVKQVARVQVKRLV